MAFFLFASTTSIYNSFAATRSMPLGTEDEQTKFKAGDEILVYAPNSDQHATYRFDGTAWKPRDGKYFFWKRDQEDFRAFYPAK